MCAAVALSSQRKLVGKNLVPELASSLFVSGESDAPTIEKGRSKVVPFLNICVNLAFSLTLNSEY